LILTVENMKSINKIIGMLGLALTIASCQKKDEYKKFTEGGEIVYPAKIDSLRILSGNGRVKVSGALNADPKVVRFRVFWNSKLDSVDVQVNRTGGVDSVNYIIGNLQEGPMSFEVRTYDSEGHVSVPMNAVGNIYGERYRSALNNRAILSTEFNTQGEAKLKFQDITIESGTVGMQIRYKHKDNTTHDTVIVAQLKDQVVTLPKFNGNPITYRVINKPDPTSIDKFYSNYETLSLKGEVSSIYLKNYAQPMNRSAYDNNRWGTLSDWTTNAAMKNHTGGVGGYASDDGGVINVETGWNDALRITNGKIYQTVTLPAGKYAFESLLADNNDNGDPNAYIVATAGNEISNIENLSSAIGSTRVKNNRFEFVLSQTTTVSLGLVLTFEDYKYMKIRSLRLFIL
jgi:hypothetical protein